MSTFRRIPMEEILKKPLSAIAPEYQKALDAGTFEFGVDKTEMGYRLMVNAQIIGVYLYSDADDFRKQIKSPYEAVIVPDQFRARTIEQENGYNIVIYVSPEDYEQFCHDAQIVYDLYSTDNLCFRSIPDIWFSDLMLVQFIRDYLHPHPAMQRWFGPSIHGWAGSWVGPKFTR